MIKITEINDKKIWDKFLENPEIKYFPLFQSWSWGEVQQRLGYSISRIGVYKNKQLVAVCQIIDIKAKRGHYLHLRHGPVLIPFDQEVFDALITHVKKIAEVKKASFIRLSPVVEKHHINLDMLKTRGMINAPIHRMDAEICWVLDITRSEEELLKNMRKSHRYLIKKGIMSKELRIMKTKNIKDIGKFLNLYLQLSKRKHFVPHRGVAEEFEIFSKEDQEVLHLAEYQKKIIAGALIAYVGTMAIYRHSASDDEYRYVPAMYLIQWEAIKEAKRRGMKLYNFWGIAGTDAPKRHPWQGHTLFKTGFGGEIKEFLHTQDLPLSPAYWKTYVIEFASKIIKGY